MIDTVHKALNVIGARRDLVVVALLVTAIAMMVLPLPTWLVDILLAFNLSAAILLLMMGLYLRDPLDFTTLPSVILIVTIFRLALSVTTTRLILSQADAGEIIETFGNYVIAGNIVVGMVIFLIITVVQFVVITKGAERVAEVSARFTLDALPGKQMAIDSDLRSGDIDGAEARKRRKKLAQESQFYGAMDGSMKFVKGDAIAGLVIIAVNLIGGMAVGVMQKGLETGEAAAIYSILTIGDGLASQLPALFISLAAGAIVTRVADEDSGNLGDDITGQMFNNPATLRTSAVVIAGFGFAPGFPTVVFLLISGLLLTISYGDLVRDKIFGPPEIESDEDIDDRSEAELSAATSPFSLRIPPGSLSETIAAEFVEQAAAAAGRVSEDIGVSIAPARLDQTGDGDTAELLLEDVPVETFRFRSDRLIVATDAATATLASIDAEPAGTAPGLGEIYWAPLDAKAQLEANGLEPLDPEAYLMRVIEAAQRRHGPEGIGAPEARALLAQSAAEHPQLAAELRDMLPAAKLAEVLRRLADEGAPLKHRRALLQALIEWAPKEQDPVVLTEYVRTALARQISHAVAGDAETLPAYVLDRAAEDAVRAAIRQTTVGEYLALDDQAAERLVNAVRQAGAGADPAATQAVVLTSLDVRRFVRSLLKAHGLRDTPVLSYQDVTPQLRVTPVATISL